MVSPPPRLARLAEVHDLPIGTACTAHAAIRQLRHGLDRNGEGYYDLVVGDASARIPAKIWGDSRAYGELARSGLETGAVVKLMFSVGEYRDAIQLTVSRIRGVVEGDEWSSEAIWGRGWELIQDLRCKTLVFDIETVPGVVLDAEDTPESVRKAVARAAERSAGELDALEAQTKAMSLSPYFGKIVSLAVGEGELDEDEDEDDDGDEGEGREGAVTALVVPPPGREDEEYPPWIRPMSEADLLRCFWHLADAAELVVSYNGRGFDVPFLQARSLIHGVPARVDLLSSPYSLRPHLDLFRLLSPGRGGTASTSLDVICWSLGITSPKGEMDGSLVAPTYARGEIETIAEYNVGDVRATARVYRHLREHLLPFRNDW
ncbi:ribonuclease H-like domain-containing protein [Pseudenhygromyxa sp. WMMC2535]|uniref:ribonuclease H-like domain-containing protein n=1 Tax=Pseudenhygromyxa sp. WMMC2535 TaxID=2712867 RepID=UPI00155213A0|nr:ribonuclease H-like domain-containing protein [Pseudenhygromyxa sp. WMMC2535]NVB41910.1 ribonuclease H-like domain-containing protein [Pseudenhygromyxa sp. WMMC2535]